MAIKRIEASNFRSFERIEVELRDFNVVIGANASGKSNFIQLLRFLSDIANHGLGNAVSMQGGVEYLRNIRIGSSQDLTLVIAFEEESPLLAITSKGQVIGVNAEGLLYEFQIHFASRAPGFEIVKDQLTVPCRFVNLEGTPRKFVEGRLLGKGKLLISSTDGRR